jgi:hypothetical protein
MDIIPIRVGNFYALFPQKFDPKNGGKQMGRPIANLFMLSVKMFLRGKKVKFPL